MCAAFTATDTQVFVQVGSSSSGYSNKIYWSTDNFKTKHFVGVDNRIAKVFLGTFKPGTQFEFGIDNGNGGFFKTGSGAVNPDGIVHAQVQKRKAFTSIGFEDFLGGGDFDFNDALISVMSQPAEKMHSSTASGRASGDKTTLGSNSTNYDEGYFDYQAWFNQLVLNKKKYGINRLVYNSDTSVLLGSALSDSAPKENAVDQNLLWWLKALGKSP